MTKEKIIATLRETKGVVHEAAEKLGTTPQGIYHHISSDPEISRALDAIREDLKKPIKPALQALTVDEEEIALAMLGSDTSKRTAARKLLVGKIAESTGRSAREVSDAIRQSKTLTALFEKKLPAVESIKRDPGETLGVTLTTPQLAWTKKQPRGAIARLVLASIGKEAPLVKPLDDAHGKGQTSFRLPLPAIAWLRMTAQAQGTTAQAVLREVIDAGRLDGRKAAQAHDDAPPTAPA